jgi:hypothetical protein
MKTLKMMLFCFVNFFAFAQSQAQSIPFANGQTVRIYCLGHVEGSRYLNGVPTTGELNLTNNPALLSTQWIIRYAPNGLIYLQCAAGTSTEADYLDGATHLGNVRLVKTGERDHFTGTLWHLMPYRALDGTIAYYIRCQGHLDGTRFLDGNTGENKVSLTNLLGFPVTGSSWRITKVQ